LDEGDYKAMLTRSYDIILCDFMRDSLTHGDIMIDVGANVGYITAVGASHVGAQGEVHSFEPLRECYARLATVAQLNPGRRIVCNQLALGDQETELPISFDPQGDSRNATLVPGYQRPVRYTVAVTRLDSYIAMRINAPQRIKLIKIDVEGFEFAVLRGAEGFLGLTHCNAQIVVEIKPWEVERLGYTMREFSDYMASFGYQAYEMLNRGRTVDLTAMREIDVVLFKRSS
jgi:FkbM family methyltransferase